MFVITRKYRNVQQRIIKNGLFCYILVVRSNINLFIRNDCMNILTYFVVSLNVPKGALLY